MRPLFRLEIARQHGALRRPPHAHPFSGAVSARSPASAPVRPPRRPEGKRFRILSLTVSPQFVIIPSKAAASFKKLMGQEGLSDEKVPLFVAFPDDAVPLCGRGPCGNRRAEGMGQPGGPEIGRASCRERV